MSEEIIMMNPKKNNAMPNLRILPLFFPSSESLSDPKAKHCCRRDKNEGTLSLPVIGENISKIQKWIVKFMNLRKISTIQILFNYKKNEWSDFEE